MQKIFQGLLPNDSPISGYPLTLFLFAFFFQKKNSMSLHHPWELASSVLTISDRRTSFVKDLHERKKDRCKELIALRA